MLPNLLITPLLLFSRKIISRLVNAYCLFFFFSLAVSLFTTTNATRPIDILQLLLHSFPEQVLFAWVACDTLGIINVHVTLPLNGFIDKESPNKRQNSTLSAITDLL